jgi:hypothetical protein
VTTGAGGAFEGTEEVGIVTGIDVAQGGATLTPVGLPDEAAQIREEKDYTHSKSSTGNKKSPPSY